MPGEGDTNERLQHSMELRDYLRILRAHWVGVALITLAVLAATALYTFTQDKVYAANATGFVTTGVADDPALSSIGDELSQSRATSYVDIAQSRATAPTPQGPSTWTPTRPAW